MPADHSTSGIAAVTWVVADGLAVMPPPVVLVLAAAAEDVLDLLNPDEMDWLHRLAGGANVSELANFVGYSERTMKRRLKSVYTRLGVRTKAEAMARVIGLD